MPAYFEGPGLVRANVGAFGGTGVSSDQPGAGSDDGLARAMLQLTAQISELATLVAKFVGAMAEERSASTIKWDRKRPIIKANDAESLMTELAQLENAYAELNCRTYRKKWSIFRPSLEGRPRQK